MIDVWTIDHPINATATMDTAGAAKVRTNTQANGSRSKSETEDIYFGWPLDARDAVGGIGRTSGVILLGAMQQIVCATISLDATVDQWSRFSSRGTDGRLALPADPAGARKSKTPWVRFACLTDTLRAPDTQGLRNNRTSRR